MAAPPEVQFQKNDSEETRLEKLRRLAQAVANIKDTFLATGALINRENHSTLFPIISGAGQRFHLRDVTLTVGAYQLVLEGARGGYGAGISFQSEISGSPFTLVPMAKIVADGEGVWNATASTQDAYVTIHVAENGALVERLRISSAGVVIVTAPVRLKGYTVAGLPAGTQGDTAYVTNALAPAFGVAVVGGGAVVCPVFYDGAAWIVR